MWRKNQKSAPHPYPEPDTSLLKNKVNHKCSGFKENIENKRVQEDKNKTNKKIIKRWVSCSFRFAVFSGSVCFLFQDGASCGSSENVSLSLVSFFGHHFNYRT